MIKQLLAGVAAAAVITVSPSIASAQDTVDLTLVHGIPGATVDVMVDGAVVIDDFVPGSLADISSFAGQTLTNLAVVDGTSGDAVIGPVASFNVPADGSWSIVAHLDDAGTPVISSFQNNLAALGANEARVTVRHTAEAGAVDLIVGDQRPIVGAVNGDSAELELPSGDLTDAQLAPTGDVAIAQIATIDLAANTNTVIYAVGSVGDDTLDFVVQVVDLPVDTTATSTTTSTTTSSTTATPSAVNTGSPLDDSGSLTLLIVGLGALTVTGGALLARRRL